MRILSNLTVILLCALSLSGPATTLAAEVTVGDWSAPERIAIVGTHAWTADEVRAALVADLEVVLAGHPIAPLAPLPPLLTERVCEGYRHAGFPQVKATAKIDHDKKQIVVAVEEGPRYVAGDIRVTGARQLDAESLKNWLTSKRPGDSARFAGFEEVNGQAVAHWVESNGQPADMQVAAWEAGKPICDSPTKVGQIEKTIARAMAAQGFHSAKYKVALVEDHVTRLIALELRIEKEGSATNVGRIEVEGSDRDTKADVITYLDLHEGMLINEASRSQLLHKLWMSGRYLKQEVTLQVATKPGEPTAILIKLRDYPAATPLAKPLSTAEQAMLNCRAWVLAAVERGEAVSARVMLSSVRVRCATAKGRGAFCFVEPLRAEGGAIDNSTSRACLIATTMNDFLMTYEGATQKVQMPVVESQARIAVHLDATDPAQDKNKSFQLALGVSLSSKYKTATPEPFAFSMTAAPVSMIALAHREGAKSTTADGVLTIESGASKFRIEVASGRLLECTLDPATEGGEPVSISFGGESFATQLAEVKRLIGSDPAKLPNAYEPTRSASSIAEFALKSPLPEWLLQWREVNGKDRSDWLLACGAISKLIRANVLQPLDDYILDYSKPGPDHFDIPSARDEAGKLQGDDGLATMINGVSRIALGGVDNTFPRNSWPWTSTRSLAMVMLGQAGGDDLGRLLGSKDLGPVGRLTWATMSEYMSGEIAGGIAKSGIERVNLRGFQADYAPLLAPDKHAGKMVIRVAEALRDLEPEETAALGRVLFGKRAKLLTSAANQLRELREEPIDKALRTALDQIWTEGLSEVVAEQLKAIYLRNVKFVREKKEGSL